MKLPELDDDIVLKKIEKGSDRDRVSVKLGPQKKDGDPMNQKGPKKEILLILLVFNGE